MEQVHGTHKASKFEPQDFISGMPDNVITNILDRLPIQDAVKTDVLSKYWRFKWTLLTHLIFDADFFRTLHLKDVHFSNSTFGMIIGRCPLLEILSYFDDDNTCETQLIKISKLENLKKLSWSVCFLDEPMNMIRRSSFYQLSALPKLQELILKFGCGKFMAEACVDKKVPVAFLCLKTLTLSKVNFDCDIMTSFVLEMICNSPNLQNLNITGSDCYDDPYSAVCCLDLCCNTVKQLQLRSVSFSCFRGSENEVCLIKFILASFPLLKKIVISADQDFLEEHAGIAWRMAGKLLNLQRDFLMVDIDLC